MPNKISIITSGGSQLIIQLATLKSEVKIVDQRIIILYNGVFRESLDQFFKEVAIFYNCEYIGQINFDFLPEQTSIKKLLKEFMKKRRYSFDKEIINRFPILKSLHKADLLIIPIRVKMFSDIVLLSFLKPKKILYSIDGVIDVLPERSFGKFRFPYLKNYLKKLPINSSVFSPSYLIKDANRIGVYKEIDLKNTIIELSSLPLITSFKNKYLVENVNYVIFSQHYSLSEDVLFDNEIEYYKRIILWICYLNKDNKILFKPHPRDTKQKIESIKNLNIGNLVVIEEYFQAVPIEFFIEEFNKMNSVFITGNSSAPLCFENNDKIISIFSKQLLSENLNSKIVEFAQSNNLKLSEI
ncbi:polysialyltransferase family glycosyltransferase [Flavobacterium sharifuzzamanii]|uniref:polysialyltransferase family glycosyltransferase n=1 Tax=Flavobacterium sharifuzzamanii TaxID=2211133 RepID=UPI00130081CC|nr:polysialyltransferase family glycosyltransferase [Flavobacterium sharifuzzamanii]KAF2081171.1 hypothetical protein DMA14_09185 [Flavobacterium sharifuzzamanii]